MKRNDILFGFHMRGGCKTRSVDKSPPSESSNLRFTIVGSSLDVTFLYIFATVCLVASLGVHLDVQHNASVEDGPSQSCSSIVGDFHQASNINVILCPPK